MNLDEYELVPLYAVENSLGGQGYSLLTIEPTYTQYYYDYKEEDEPIGYMLRKKDNKSDQS